MTTARRAGGWEEYPPTQCLPPRRRRSCIQTRLPAAPVLPAITFASKLRSRAAARRDPPPRTRLPAAPVLPAISFASKRQSRAASVAIYQQRRRRITRFGLIGCCPGECSSIWFRIYYNFLFAQSKSRTAVAPWQRRRYGTAAASLSASPSSTRAEPLPGPEMDSAERRRCRGRAKGPRQAKSLQPRVHVTREQVESHFAAYGRVVDVYRQAPGEEAPGQAYVVCVGGGATRAASISHVMNGRELVVERAELLESEEEAGEFTWCAPARAGNAAASFPRRTAQRSRTRPRR